MDKSEIAPSAPPIVYVVDQDPAVCEGLCLLLSTVGLDFESYESAEHFLERLGHLDPDRPGCLVIEVELPGLSGLDLLDRLRESKVDLPTVVLARHADVGHAVRAMRSGAIDFLEKPFVDRILLKRVLHVLDRGAGREPAGSG